MTEITTSSWQAAKRKGLDEEEQQLQRSIGSVANEKSLGMINDDHQ